MQMKSTFTSQLLALCAAAWIARAEQQVLLVPQQYSTIQSAVDAAQPGDKIIVGPGDYAGAVIRKPMQLFGAGVNTRINQGTPENGNAGFIISLKQQDVSEPGVSIRQFGFESLPFPDQSGMFVGVSARPAGIETSVASHFNIDVSHNVFRGGYYAVYLLNCNRCTVSHNEIYETMTPIMVWAASDVSSDSTIAQNSIQSAVQGTAAYDWMPVGIWLNAILRGTLKNTQVIQNQIVRTGGSSESPYYAVYLKQVTANVTGSYIGLNDFRGSDAGAFVPTGLADRTEISNNLEKKP